MRTKQPSIAESLAQTLAAFQPGQYPKKCESIFPEDAGAMMLNIKLLPKDLAALQKQLAAGRAAGRLKFNVTQAIRACIRSAQFDLKVVDAVIAEDPRRKANRSVKR